MKMLTFRLVCIFRGSTSLQRPSQLLLNFREDCQLNLEKLKQHCKKEVKVLKEVSFNPHCSRFVYVCTTSPFYHLYSRYLEVNWPFVILFFLRVAARIPTGFGMRKFKRKNVLMSNDFICVVKAKRKQ